MKQIGSDYHILYKEVDKFKGNNPNINTLSSLPRDYRYLSTCRSAISWILMNEISTEKKRVMVPGFTCHSVLEPCEQAGYDVFPYPIANNLTIIWEEFLESVKSVNPGVVIFHSYFGFNTLVGVDKIIDSLQGDDIVIIEDRTQCVFSDFKTNADYVVGSIRKWLPIPDGAFIRGAKSLGEFREDDELCNAKLTALNSKAEYIEYGIGDSTAFRKLFAQAEDILDSRHTPFKMHHISKLIFQNTNIEWVKKIRQENYKILINRLKKHKDIELLLDCINEGDVPFQLPVMVKSNRKALQSYLAKNGIFATVIWACPEQFVGKINVGAEELFDNILCFHCDQRYGASDMNRIGDVIDNFYND